MSDYKPPLTLMQADRIRSRAQVYVTRYFEGRSIGCLVMAGRPTAKKMRQRLNAWLLANGLDRE